jgi:predicted nucleic acid-binding protein
MSGSPGVLVDTSYLLAIAISKDKNHEVARQALSNIDEQVFLPVPVLPEIFYMIQSRVGYDAAVRMYHRLRLAPFLIEDLTFLDMNRIEAIMHHYRSAEFDFVDVSIMALSERLNIRKIYTFDRRDFVIFRPSHISYFELLP